MVGGSDAHYYREIGYSYTVAKGADDLEDLRKSIAGNKTRAEGEKAPLRYLTLRPFSLDIFKRFYVKNNL